MFKHTPNHSLSNIWKLNDLLDTNKTESDIKQVMQRAIKNCKLSISKNKNRERYSESRIKHPFKVGSIVYLENHSLSNKAEGYQAKMDLRYTGPYRILYFLSPVSVLLQLTNDTSVIKRAHIKSLKLK